MTLLRQSYEWINPYTEKREDDLLNNSILLSDSVLFFFALTQLLHHLFQMISAFLCVKHNFPKLFLSHIFLMAAVQC